MLEFASIIIFFTFILGIILLFWGARSKNAAALIVGTAILIWDVLILTSVFLNNADLLAMLLSFAMSALFMWLGILAITDAIHCNHRITAVYVGYHSRRYYNSPIFEYQYDGIHYRQQAGTQFFSKRFLRRKFQEKEAYEIYINPQKPHRIVIMRKVQFLSVFLILVGLAFSALFIFSLLDLILARNIISM